MAKGWQGIKEQTDATAEARARANDTFLPELRVNARNPGPYIIRFLEQGEEVHNFPVHEYSVPNPQVAGGQVIRKFTCLSEVGQECSGCKAGMKIKRRGVFNVIQRNRPVYRRGADKKVQYNADKTPIIDGYRDEIVVTNVGGPTSEMLRKLDSDARGLMSRDFQVSFSGDTFQSWTVAHVLDSSGASIPTPLSEADIALVNAGKHDLDKYMAPPSLQEAAQIVARYVTNQPIATPGQSAPVAPGQPAPDTNPYLSQLQPGALPAGGAFGAVSGS